MFAWLTKIIGQFSNSTYKFSPVRRILIPKADGKTRPLGIPTASDKQVHSVMKLIQERIYEHVFSPKSYGFRRGCSCHEALLDIKHHWIGVKWLIDIDVVFFLTTLITVFIETAGQEERGQTFSPADWKYAESGLYGRLEVQCHLQWNTTRRCCFSNSCQYLPARNGPVSGAEKGTV
ncbi:reverse transcriptase domain-containing protein [Enterobacter cloacae complex sp. P38RS]|uniref:reverse transcriptase domain-containing protein n=1 Tax=Enterobacter cloacae complex sp. P38RS TaxID=2779553 RepID=UPI00187241F0|nr:reverse transcriptase domain-containing protein [Enterobacter cloacae complex sp. P38RS]MBE4871344.1 hypothetical protein [Enterobacter cloacae complex sp. P38RS]MBT1809233.1 hypothetical protein [Enterobacter hormaechei subsp. xiangfangensis]